MVKYVFGPSSFGVNFRIFPLRNLIPI